MEGQHCHGKRETRAGTAKQSSSPALASGKVLGDDDLLCEILRRVDSPTTLVRAAVASKRWLRRVAADPAFLRRFRQRHPPRLLGFYVTGDSMPRPEFVAMPNAETELAAALRRAASSAFDAFPPFSSSVWDSRDGRVLFDFADTMFGRRRLAVRDPMRRPGGAKAELPPTATSPERFHAALLPGDERDDATCYRVDVGHAGRTVSAEVTVLRSGAWTVVCSARAELAKAPERIPLLTLLAGGNKVVYVVTVAGYLVGVDLATASLFTIEFPDGVAYEYYGNLVPSRADGDNNSVLLYLFHVKGDKLSVWLRRRTDDGNPAAGAGEWVLRDTVSVKETCGGLLKQGSEPSFTSVVGVGDNAEFVFLELGEGDSSFVVYLHLGTRKAERVYERDPENDEIIQVHPFTMPWPPVFPELLLSPPSLGRTGIEHAGI